LHAIPSADERIVPLSPTATSVDPFQACAARYLVVGEVTRVHVACASADAAKVTQAKRDRQKGHIVTPRIGMSPIYPATPSSSARFSKNRSKTSNAPISGAHAPFGPDGGRTRSD